MMSNKIIEMTFLAFWGCGVALLACARESGDGQDASDVSPASGGYTGLGKYTGVSGVYGDGVTASGGTSRHSSPEPSTTTDSGGATHTGDTVATEGGAPSTDATSVGGASGGSTSKVAVASGGHTNQGGATNSRAVGGSVTGGRSSGSATSNGGTSNGGTSNGGTSNGGTGGTVATQASTVTGSSFNWPSSYNPSGVPSNSSGKHNPGTNCMGSACHASSQASRAFAFGGTIYQPGGTTPAANAQVAITFGSTTVTTYSGTNGNFWLPLSAAATIDWSNATVHVRNSKGELAKPSTATVNASCNSCHSSSMRITTP